MGHLKFNQLYQTLQKQPYINIPFPLGRTAIEEAVQAFFKFLNEPEDVKSHIDFSISAQHRRGDVGYKHRQAGDHIYNDDKSFFHFHPALFEKYATFLERQPVVYDFVLKAQSIWDFTYQVIRDILLAFEPQFPGICDKVFDHEQIHLLLRFLKYEWQSAGKYLAKPHFDAGSFTLAIAESCAGLRIGTCSDNLKAVEHKDEEAIFMLSSNFQKIMSNTQLSPGWHDVIQLDETLIGKPFSRWAVVAFIDAQGVEALPRTETHKWYQQENAPQT